jgi:hypothetical protein
MSEGRIDGRAWSANRHCATASLGAADWLSLAAAPTFAIMALLTGALGGPPDILCLGQNASSLAGMVPMYVLMSAFHSAPWLKLLSRRAASQGLTTELNQPACSSLVLSSSKHGLECAARPSTELRTRSGVW